LIDESLLTGVYRADRAAALAGVPRSTLYYRADHDVWVPTRRSDGRPKLWTFSDIVATRIIYWLRQPKAGDGDGPDIDAPSPPGCGRDPLAW
jgi:hypothetical protein